MVCVMTVSETDRRADMIMKTDKFLSKMLLANQKSGVSGVFRDLGSLVVLQKVLAY